MNHLIVRETQEGDPPFLLGVNTVDSGISSGSAFLLEFLGTIAGLEGMGVEIDLLLEGQQGQDAEIMNDGESDVLDRKLILRLMGDGWRHQSSVLQPHSKIPNSKVVGLNRLESPTDD